MRPRHCAHVFGTFRIWRHQLFPFLPKPFPAQWGDSAKLFLHYSGPYIATGSLAASGSAESWRDNIRWHHMRKHSAAPTEIYKWFSMTTIRTEAVLKIQRKWQDISTYFEGIIFNIIFEIFYRTAWISKSIVNCPPVDNLGSLGVTGKLLHQRIRVTCITHDLWFTDLTLCWGPF